MSGPATYKQLIAKIKSQLGEPLPGRIAQEQMAPSVRTDLTERDTPNDSTRRSAVLLMLYPRQGELYFPLIKRQIYDGPHSGQVSFPGGKFEEIDENLQQTALRESNEEIGIDPASIEVLGKLSELYIPISNLRVCPLVGFLNRKPNFTPNLQEVEYVIEVPLSELVNEKRKSVMVITSHGRPVSAPYYDFSNEMVWGATAMILSEFEEVVHRLIKK